MSTIYFVIYILFLLLTISARPAPTIIYSAVIYNGQSSTIQCNVIWLVPSGSMLQSDPFSIRKGNIYQVNERIIDMGTWEARAIINKIQCGNLVLNSPFKGVSAPSVNWKFLVQSDRIVSVAPDLFSSHAN